VCACPCPCTWCVSDRLSIGLLTDTRTEAQLVLRNRFVDTSRCGSHIQKLMPKECRGASKHAQAIDAALAPRRRNRRSEVRAAALFDAAASSASARATARRPHVAASALAKPRASLAAAPRCSCLGRARSRGRRLGVAALHDALLAVGIRPRRPRPRRHEGDEVAASREQASARLDRSVKA
jgi:hypothetical protein